MSVYIYAYTDDVSRVWLYQYEDEGGKEKVKREIVVVVCVHRRLCRAVCAIKY